MFLRHTNCERCGSSDGRALYRGGSSFCFVCRRGDHGSISPYLLLDDLDEIDLSLPGDITHDYPKHVMEWVGRYGITASELQQRNVFYSAHRDQLIFAWMGEDGGTEPILWQARNFNPKAKSKCYTKGTPDSCLPGYYKNVRLDDSSREVRSRLVLVEDPVSAIKVARYSDSMPVLGSDLSTSKLKRLATFLGPSTEIVVWLDGNMFHKAQKIAQRLQLLGLSATAVYTELDPKCYSDTEIVSILARTGVSTLDTKA